MIIEWRDDEIKCGVCGENNIIEKYKTITWTIPDFCEDLDLPEVCII